MILWRGFGSRWRLEFTRILVLPGRDACSHLGAEGKLPGKGPKYAKNENQPEYGERPRFEYFMSLTDRSSGACVIKIWCNILGK